MKLLELFAGSRSIGKVAGDMGHKVFSSDINGYEGIDYQVDILDFDCSKVPFTPDVIWASPPCQTFSVASIGAHWGPGRQPKTEEARMGIKIIEKTLEIIRHFDPPVWYIENPRGMLRTLPMMRRLPIRHTVTYCQYGDKRMKPTDVWTNNMLWIPRPVCKNGDNCHEAAPRGSRTGTQGLKNAYERSRIPEEFCREILTFQGGKC